MVHKTLEAGNEEVHYHAEGQENRPALILLSGLGTTSELWRPHLTSLEPWFRVIRIEHPGHFGEAARKGPYTIDDLALRVISVVDAEAVDRFSIAGISLGAMIAIRLAARHGDRVDKVVVCNTAPVIGPPELWHERAASARAEGVFPSRQTLIERWFSAPFVASAPEVVKSVAAMMEGIDPEGYASCCEALATTDLNDDIGNIGAPTLVVGGSADVVVPTEVAASLSARIADASLVILGGAGHLAGTEQPERFAAALLTHLTGDVLERGATTRAVVLGEQHVQSATQSSTTFSAPFQQFMTKMYWGEVWSRPGVDVATRRVINIAMLSAIGHMDGLAIHVREALRNGVSAEVIYEVLLQCAVCVGVPAANRAISVAGRIVDEELSSQTAN